MKRFLIATIISVMTSFAYAQNLVPNPSFEDTAYCPFGLNQLEACSLWQNFGNSPDYFNTCATSGVNVPNSVFGYQYAHIGSAIAGLATYRQPSTPNGPNYREFIGIELLQPLNVGEKYYFSFFTNYSHYHPFQAVASNNVGLKFFTAQFDSCCHPPLDNFAQLFSAIVITDSVNWIRLSGSFIADSAYSYLSIGNFFDDNHTDTIELSSLPDGAYYYIDDVCVTIDSLYNELWTGINIFNSDVSIHIFPNPINDYIDLKAPEVIERIEIYDNSGKVLIQKFPMDHFYHLTVSTLSQGIYLMRIRISNMNITKRFLKITR